MGQDLFSFGFWKPGLPGMEGGKGTCNPKGDGSRGHGAVFQHLKKQRSIELPVDYPSQQKGVRYGDPGGAHIFFFMPFGPAFEE